MKKWILVAIGVVTVIIAIYGRYALWSLDHVIYATAISPSKKMTAVVILLGEGADPPYGQSIVIYRTSSLLGPVTGEEIFRGYGGKTDLIWRTDTELEVRCVAGKKVKVQKTKADTVQISYVVEPNAT